MSQKTETVITAKVETPSVPNFVRIVYGDGQEHMTSLASFSDEMLEALARDWKSKLYKNRDRLKANGVK